MAEQWLSTAVNQQTSRGTSISRTIVMSGTDTTVQSEDEGVIVSFDVIVESGLGTVPAGDTGPSPICS